MKKMMILGAIAALFVTINAQAQSEQVNKIAAEDGVAALEAARAETAAKAIRADKLERGDTVWMNVGNACVQTEVWSQRIEGPYVGIAGGAVYYDEAFSPAVALQGGYFGRHWGLSVTGSLSKGEWTGESEKAGKDFLEVDIRLNAQLRLLTWRNGHSSLSLIGGPTFKRRFDRQTAELNGEYTLSDKVKLIIQDDDRTTRAYTLGGEAGLRYEHKWWGAPCYMFIEAAAGGATNFLRHGKVVKLEAHAQIGLAINLFRGTAWNKAALANTGMSKGQLKKAARASVANY